MDASQLNRAKELFAAISAIPPDERIEWLSRHCEDETLASEVLDLASRAGQLGDFLDGSIAEALGSRISTPLAPGQLLNGRYRVVGQLSTGGFATVYLGVDERLAERRVAIKVVDRVEGPSETISREIRALAKITDRGVVGIFDCGELDSGVPFLVTQYIEGCTLREILKAGVPNRAEGLRLIRKIAHALAAAHDHGIPHLDIKPENIMVGTSGEVTIIDFGLSSLYGAGIALAGSAPYMAPEQGLGAATIRSDIYSLGVLACEILTGKPKQQDVRSALSGVERFAVRAVERALKESPEERQANAAEFAAEFDFRPKAQRLFWTMAAAAAIFGTVLSIRMFWGDRLPLAEAVPVTALPGFERDPAFSPDGTRLYFESGTDDKARDLYYVENQKTVRLTSHPGDERRVACSMDGSQIAFIREYAGVLQDILLMPAKGGAETVVARIASPYSMAWSASGRSLLVSSEGETGRFAVMRVLDLQTRQWRGFIDPPANTQGDIEPSLSPDGKRIVFVRRENSATSDLYIQRVDADLHPQGQPQRLTFSRIRKHSPNWTPDGREIVYTLGPSSLHTVWRVPADGGQEKRIGEVGSRAGLLTIPKHVWKLAYTVDNTDSNLWRARLKTPNGPLVDKSVIASSSFDDEEVRLSPEEDRIVFTSHRLGSEQVFTANIEGGDVRQVSKLDTVDSVLPYWMPDSKRLLLGINAKPEGRRTVLLDLESGHQEVLVRGMIAVGISADGKRALLRSSKTGRDEIWSYSFDSGALKQLTHIGSRFARESPDGRQLFFSHSDSADALWVRQRDGRTSKVVNDMALPALFAVRENGVYYVDRHLAAIYLHRFSDGKNIELLKLEKPPFWGFDVSSDGKMIFYSQYENNNIDVMLIDNFR